MLHAFRLIDCQWKMYWYQQKENDTCIVWPLFGQALVFDNGNEFNGIYLFKLSRINAIKFVKLTDNILFDIAI